MNVYWIGAVFIVLLSASSGEAFDLRHSQWQALVEKHVVWIDEGGGSQVDYAGFQEDRGQLKAYLDGLSAVTRKVFDGWSKTDQLAFLINAYNAFTVELILTRYPDLESIRDLRSLFRSPWKKKFFRLLGDERHLDWVEHDMIRAPGVYDDPRIHMAVNCASIGCPALRDEAFVGDRIDDQLEDGVRRFLRDRSRNRYDPRSETLEVSKIFDWYGGDFNQGHQGYDSLEDFFAEYAVLLTDTPEDAEKVRSGSVEIRHLPYDWDLNDLRR